MVVALAIVAIGMLAVFKTIGDTVHNITDLRDRTFAAWIADNRITEIRISGEMPSVDETAGELEFAGRRWTGSPMSRRRKSRGCGVSTSAFAARTTPKTRLS